ncbi:HelD family protein [Janibacter limosus]|uniref:Helicase n=1 Tax=Janibacter limosus TaxID=53458 RepID=A0A4P6MWD7_9MICO|nr:UvrD-helicase domain-containing protein [Janibacter limosus]QBF47299.1 helicase [Janibacter limosus]
MTDTHVDAVAAEVATEQQHLDRVHAELAKAGRRADLVAVDGMSRGRTDRTGDVRDEEMSGLFERDALVYTAARRISHLENQHEGLVFGRLDLEHGDPDESSDREIRYIGRLGVRDDDYEPLVIDWRAPAASPFYQATPVDNRGVIRRRVLRCSGDEVIGVEDDLMVPEAPDDMVIVGDGALLAALTRTRGQQMRDIVATIQTHQDEAIRATDRGITEISGGPGTGKTVVALHRAAYLLYANRRRYESGGILVIGPSSAYTAYIERVLPSLGEDSVVLRSLGDVVDVITAVRHDPPEVAAIKGSLQMRTVLRRLASRAVPGAPTSLRAMVGGLPVRLEERVLDDIRRRALRDRSRNQATGYVRELLAQAAWRQVREGDRDEFMDSFDESMAIDDFVAEWWPQVDPREALLWLADTELAYEVCRSVLSQGDAAALAHSARETLEAGTWSVSDAALVDDLSVRLGQVEEPEREERSFYEIEELDGVEELRAMGSAITAPEMSHSLTPTNARERLLHGTVGRPGEYAHILVDEAQDLSPMQWRMIGRRGRRASWTVVGDVAQASWQDTAEADQAREEAYGNQPRQAFHMTTNYRNAQEIFDYARDVILPIVPDADIPDAVRETGVDPVEISFGDALDTSRPDVGAVAAQALDALAQEVDGSIAVITPQRHVDAVLSLAGTHDGRVVVIDPLSTKGLEWDATLVVDPDAIASESPGGARVLYVVLTRAAHRMTVLRPTD